MLPATRSSFRGLIRICRAFAIASLSASRRGCDCLPMTLGPSRLFVRRVAVIGPARSELPELVANHALVDQNGNELMTVINTECQAHELRENG